LKILLKRFSQKRKIIILGYKLATKEDLIKVYGIGEVIATRILKHKEVIVGGFISDGTTNDVWGLTPEVIENK
jgi:DNA uptake protein ComE-like DNA-binding protein